MVRHAPRRNTGQQPSSVATIASTGTVERLSHLCAAHGIGPRPDDQKMLNGDRLRPRAAVGCTFVFAVLATLACGAAGCDFSPTSDPSVTSLPTSRPDPFEDRPISLAEEAVSRSAARLPPGHAYTDAFAKKLCLAAVIDEWYGERGFDDWDPNTDVWVVGMLAEGLALNQVVQPPPFPIFQASDASAPAVAGAYYVWVASTGRLIAYGVLRSRDDRTDRASYSRLSRIVSTSGSCE